MDNIAEQLLAKRNSGAHKRSPYLGASSSSSDNDSSNLSSSDSDSSNISSSDDEVEESVRETKRPKSRLRENIRLKRVGTALSPPHKPQPDTEAVDDGCLTEREEDDFTFFPPGKGPEIKHKGTKQRAKRAILDVYNELSTSAYIELTGEEEENPTRWDQLITACWNRLCRIAPRKYNETKMTPLLKMANSQGINMLTKMLLPSMPALLQDLWVFLELLISMFAFLFGVTTFEAGMGNQKILKILTLVLAFIGMILSLIDAFIFVFYVSNLAKLVRKYLKSWRQRQHQERDTEQDGEGGENREGQRKKCRCLPQMPEKWLTRLNQFFEVVRSILSELFLYPVLMCDLIDLIALGGAAPKNTEERTNLALFSIGSFYLILAVYIMRLVTVVGTMVSMLRLPLQATGGQRQYIRIMVQFCFHAVRQIFVHLLIILAVSAKINNENPKILEDEDPIVISPFLWSALFLGWVVPLAGVLTFFVVNHYWTKEFSISFWVDMISLLQGQSFAEAVFGGEGMSTLETAQKVAEEVETVLVTSPEAKKKTLDLVEKSRLNKVKKQLKRFKSPSFLVKFFHPLELPLLALAGLFYDACLIAFMVSLALMHDSENGVTVALSGDTFLLTTFVLVIVFILLANFHLLILVNIGLSIMLFLSIVAAVYVLVCTPFFIFVYIPVASIIGYWQCWISFSKATEICRVPGMKPKHIDLELTKLMVKQRTQLYCEDNGPLLKYADPEHKTQLHPEDTKYYAVCK